MSNISLNIKTLIYQELKKSNVKNIVKAGTTNENLKLAQKVKDLASRNASLAINFIFNLHKVKFPVTSRKKYKLKILN